MSTASSSLSSTLEALVYEPDMFEAETLLSSLLSPYSAMRNPPAKGFMAVLPSGSSEPCLDGLNSPLRLSPGL